VNLKATEQRGSGALASACRHALRKLCFALVHRCSLHRDIGKDAHSIAALLSPASTRAQKVMVARSARPILARRKDGVHEERCTICV
jgi:hypothetical protein